MYTLIDMNNGDGQIAYPFTISRGEATFHVHGFEYSVAELLGTLDFKNRFVFGDDCYTKKGTFRKRLEPLKQQLEELYAQRDRGLDARISAGELCPKCGHLHVRVYVRDESVAHIVQKWRCCPWCGAAYEGCD